MKTSTKNELIIPSLATVEGDQRETNHRILQPVLYDLIALSRVLKQLHWNVIGLHFRPVHLHLDEIYALVESAIDEVAERLSATGHSPSGRMCDVTEHSEINDVPAGFIQDSEVLMLAAHNVRRVAAMIRYSASEIETVDSSSADMLNMTLLGLEKHHWMLEAQRIQPSRDCENEN